MLLVRTAATAVGLSLFVVGTSGAATKPVCNLITDDKGDSGYNGLPNSGTIDIVSADVATTKTTITAVIRVEKYTANDPATIHGKRWLLSFEGAGLQPMYLRAGETPLMQVPGVGDPTISNQFDFGNTTTDATTGQTTYGSLGAATGSINAATGEITITAKLEDLKGAGVGSLKSGVIKGLNAVTFRRVGSQLLAGDDASTSKTYPAGAVSCIKA